jgi:hypothetical protein
MEMQYSAVDRAIGYLAAGILACILLAAAASAIMLAAGV